MQIINKAERTITRQDKSQVKIVAHLMSTPTGSTSTDVYVLARKPGGKWKYCSNKRHPEIRTMSRSQYMESGRSEMFRTVTVGELLSVMQHVGKPLSSCPGARVKDGTVYLKK